MPARKSGSYENLLQYFECYILAESIQGKYETYLRTLFSESIMFTLNKCHGTKKKFFIKVLFKNVSKPHFPWETLSKKNGRDSLSEIQKSVCPKFRETYEIMS